MGSVTPAGEEDVAVAWLTGDLAEARRGERSAPGAADYAGPGAGVKRGASRRREGGSPPAGGHRLGRRRVPVIEIPERLIQRLPRPVERHERHVVRGRE